MKAKNNTAQELVARYARNLHRAKFVALNPDISEEILAIVYCRRSNHNKWLYFGNSKMPESGLKSKWYEIPIDPNEVKTIRDKTKWEYMDMLQDVQ